MMMSTTTLNNPTNTLLQQFEEFSGLYGKQTPAFQNLRKEASDKFILLGIPTTRHEEWKYVNLAPLNKINFRSVSPAEPSMLKANDITPFLFAGNNALYFVIENGRYNTNVSVKTTLPKGVTIGSLAELANDPRVQKHFGQHADTTQEAFVALNTAMSFNGVIVLIDAKAIFEQPIQLIHVSGSTTDAIAVNNRILVIAGAHSECTIIESYHSSDNTKQVFVNSVSEVVLEENATLHYSKVQVESENTFHINYHQVNQAKDSNQHITTVTLGGALVRNNLHIRLDAKNCNAYLNGLYVVNGSQLVDNHTLVDHAMPDCYSNELYKGIIDGNAHGVFNGKIFVRKDAQKTNAYQSNKNILLSNNASMNTKPQLEIFADDVKCSHGATTGQLDEEALFYLRSRGIGLEMAHALLHHAFAAAVIDQVKLEPLKDSLLELLSTKLQAKEEIVA
jgi:Fe-S cluster assembly protein SufD